MSPTFSFTGNVTQALARTVVLTGRKGFWASPACELFPHRIYTRQWVTGPGKWGSSRNPLNNLSAFAQGLAFILRHRPRLIVVGSAVRTTKWFTMLKRCGLLAQVKLLTTTQSYFSDRDAHYIDKIIVYCRSEIALHAPALRKKYEFVLLPADGEFDKIDVHASAANSYIFAGGGAGRDFPALIEAMRGLALELRIVTFSRATLGYPGELPANCKIYPVMPLTDFLTMLAGGQFVVAPLQAGPHPHGHTTIVQALSLGKAVISTQAASVDEYVTTGVEGILVPAGDVAGYRQAILRLHEDGELRRSCEAQAQQKAQELTYAKFAQRLAQLCVEMVQT